MIVHKERHGDTIILYLSGRLDGVSSPEIQKNISSSLETDCHNLILDCSNLHYMSSSGIRVLLQSYHQISKKKGKIILTSIDKPIEQTLYITGFLSYFTVYPNTQEALEALKNHGD